MPDRASLVRLGRLVMADVAAGRPGANSEMASRLLQKQPEAVLDLIDMLLAEARKPRRNENLVSAFAFMTGQALEAMRYGAEGGQEEAAGMVEAVRQRLLVLSKEDRAEPALLLLILREFALAKLDPGPELRKQMQRLAEETPASAPGPGDIETLDAHLEDLAREAGGDPFQLYEQVREMAEAFPEDHRAAMGAWLLQSREAAVREAAVGWLLDASRSVRNSAASGIEQAAGMGGVSGSMLRRLIALRNWLAEADRLALDRAIQTCRRKGVEVGALPQAQVREVLVSGIDGAGAQSIFVVAREGRKNAIASLLVKHGIGVRDAWARHGLSRAECDDFRERSSKLIFFRPVSTTFGRRRRTPSR